MLSALTLCACGRSGQSEERVGEGQTTSAVVVRQTGEAGPAPTRTACLPEVAEAVRAVRAADEEVGERAFRAPPQVFVVRETAALGAADASAGEALPSSRQPAEPAYLRPPLYDSNGSTFSDVGMPYPIPSASPPLPQATSSPPPAPPAPAPFFETSFGPPTAATGFPESSFGPGATP